MGQVFGQITTSLALHLGVVERKTGREIYAPHLLNVSHFYNISVFTFSFISFLKGIILIFGLIFWCNFQSLKIAPEDPEIQTICRNLVGS